MKCLHLLAVLFCFQLSAELTQVPGSHVIDNRFNTIPQRMRRQNYYDRKRYSYVKKLDERYKDAVNESLHGVTDTFSIDNPFLKVTGNCQKVQEVREMLAHLFLVEHARKEQLAQNVVLRPLHLAAYLAQDSRNIPLAYSIIMQTKVDIFVYAKQEAALVNSIKQLEDQCRTKGI